MTEQKKVGFGIIGAGNIASFHASSMQKLDNVKLVGFYDPIVTAAQARAEKYGVKAFGNFDEFLADPEIEAVTIAVPSGLHGQVGIAAAKAGKHILCEKPIELTLEKTDALIQACEENHVLLASVFQARFGKAVQKVREAMRAGRFGRMLMASAQMHWYRDTAYYAASGWRGTWAMDGGGALMNQAIHTVDLLLYLNGDVKEVMAYAGTLTHSIEVEDNLVAVLKFRNGSFGTIEVSTSCAPGFPRRLTFAGSTGSVTFEEDTLVRWEFANPLPEDKQFRKELSKKVDAAGGSDPTNLDDGSHSVQIHDLAECIRNGKRPMLDGHEGRRAIALISAIYESARTGVPVQL